MTAWKSPADLVTPPRADEFGVEVAAAIADLRDAHGLAAGSCQPAGRAEDWRQLLPAVNRRGFLQLTGAAAVFGLAGCAKHPDVLVAQASRSEGPGVGEPVYYASLLRDSGHPVAVVVKTLDGRPIKLDGNPDCPVVKGTSDAATQAALLNLYDPDRLQQGPLARQGTTFVPTSWQTLDAAVGAALTTGRVGLLTGPIDGPARRQLIDELVAAGNGRLTHAVYEALPRSVDMAVRGAALGVRAGRAPAAYQLDRASVLLAVGDLLGGGHAGHEAHVQWGAFRRAGGEAIVVEPVMSQTGTMADVRVRCPADSIAWYLWAVAEACATSLGQRLPEAAARELDRIRGSNLAVTLGLGPVRGGEGDAIAFAAARLLAAHQAGKRSLVYAGGTWASREVHLAACYLNVLLGNEGVTVGDGPVTALHEASAHGGTTAQALLAGPLDALIVMDCNPAYSLPGAAAAIARVPLVVAVADRRDETAELAHWIAPTTHGLESWGDAEVAPGVYALQQPTIRPLWDAREAEQSLIAFAAVAGFAAFVAPVTKTEELSVVARRPLWRASNHGVRAWADYVRSVWSGAVHQRAASLATPQAFWTAALARGVVEVPVPTTREIRIFDPAAATGLAGFRAATGYRLVLSASRTLRDGAQANNPWLQELPDPVSKITWDNYLAVSPADAQRELLGEGSVVTLTVNGSAIAVPVHVQEGQHPGTLELFLGWGRTQAGQVAGLTDGFAINAFALAHHPLAGIHDATLAAAGRTYELAGTQGHDRIAGRPMPLDTEGVGHALAANWQTGTDGKPGGRLSLWRTSPAYVGRKWGMTIDMDACTGCNACVVACSAENNVPVVGRDEVRKNRELHWIRIDRYYSGDESAKLDVDVVHQPMMCQHCDNAPCEVVCPANATMHNNEGVSLQIYNRCIGTRYCANNCPYKVRRFNWYEYSQYRAGPQGSSSPLARIQKNLITEGRTSAAAEMTHAPLQLLLNPEVTVRSKGVMEKCNFCVQRLRDIRDEEKTDGKALPDGAITTACAQTCPSQAIVFGDLNDDRAKVVTLGNDHAGRAFKALDEELNTRPAVAYLKRIRHREAAAHVAGSHP
jgi:molybdopterin-containing oxidoreductase family iron-sulfur binding subunit